MQILEGQAYFPEILVTKIVSRVAYTESYPEKRRFMDDGTDGGQELTNETILAGRPVGNSNFAKNNIKRLFENVKEDGESVDTQFHGGGSRFIEHKNGTDSLVGRCARFLPVNDAYDIKVIQLCGQQISNFYTKFPTFATNFQLLHQISNICNKFPTFVTNFQLL